MGTALAIGGWFAQSIIQSSIDKLSSSAFENHRLNLDMKNALRSLNISLSKANSILNSRQEMKAETNLNNLLNDLKEAAYDVGDLLDDLKYEELKKRVEEDEEGDLSEKNNTQQLLSDFLSSAYKFASDLFNDPTSKVREVQKRLDEITAAIVSISTAVGTKEPAGVREETSSFSRYPEEVFGRAEDQKRLTELLLKQDDGSGSSNNNVLVPIISLVGMGGVGKTTLAQWACSELENKFDEKIWICASDPFDVNRLTRDIVQNVDKAKEHSMVTQLDKLQQIVKQQLTSKRFLLAVDDVWNEDRRRWETFYAPLRFGAPGSKILVTTRSHKVVATMNSKNTLLLEGLQKDEYYSFFNRCAFGNEDPKKYGRMEAIGRNIAARLKGLPLAAKTLGSLLNAHLNNEDYWRNIQDSEIWNLQQSDNDIMPVLKLSFDNLSSRLKPCFAYCSLFPKDYIFQKDIIVQMWMAHDFIVPEGNLRMEDVGYRYFDDLFSRCLFEKLPDNDFYLHGDLYVMHDLLHDLAQSISKDECVRLECGGSQDIPSTVRHLSVCVPYSGELNITDVICKHRKLRTLLFVSSDHRKVEFCVELKNLLSHLTCVRVMMFKGRSFKELPYSIGELKQLRYLDITYTEIKEFPASLRFLYNLQRFKVGPDGESSYPEKMENLVNLREIPEEKFICQVADIGRLRCLQQLKTFNIKKELGHKIEELEKLTELGGRLRIEHLESIDSKEEAMKAKLKDKKYLRELSLHWASDRPADLRGIDVADVQVLEGLEPHPNLKELTIQDYGGIKYPSWLESQLLSNLITIKLIGCKNMEKLPPLGQLQEIIIENCPKLKALPSLPPSVVRFEIKKNMELNEFPPIGHLSGLKILRYNNVRCLVAVRKIEDLFGAGESKGFQSLEVFELVDMPELEEWSGVYGSQFFPCLNELVIQNCPELRNLPSLPPSLLYLKLIKVGLDALLPVSSSWVSQESSSSSSRQNASLCQVHIESCPNLKSVELWLLPNQLPDLWTISIIDCAELTSLAIERFKDLTSLGFLTLKYCPKLTSAAAQAAGEDNLLFPSSLFSLELGDCGDLERSLLLCLRGATSLIQLTIRGNYRHIISLPGEFFHHLTKLEYWTVDGLTELKTLGSLQRFTSLSRLIISDCPQLKALPEDSLPNLNELSLYNCDPDLKEGCQKDTGVYWPKIAHIPRIKID